MNANTALGEYAATKNAAALADATPHKLIAMLIDGALEGVAKAMGGMRTGDVAVAGEGIGKAMDITHSLQAMLDQDSGGEIAANLDRLYEYIGHRLLLASKDKDPAILHEVSSLLRELKDGWDSIPLEFHDVSG